MVQSQSETLLRMVQGLLVVALIAHNANAIQSDCNNQWTWAILKGVGIQCVSMALIVSVVSALSYWEYQESRRIEASPDRDEGIEDLLTSRGNYTVAGDIVDIINPGTVVGMTLHLMLSYALFMYFTKNCAV